MNNGFKIQYAITEVTSGTNVKYTGTYVYAPASVSSLIGKTLSFEMNVTVATSAYGYSLSRAVSSDMDKILIIPHRPPKL